MAGNLVFALPGFSLAGSFGFAYSAADGITVTLGTDVPLADLPAGATQQAVTLNLGDPATPAAPTTRSWSRSPTAPW